MKTDDCARCSVTGVLFAVGLSACGHGDAGAGTGGAGQTASNGGPTTSTSSGAANTGTATSTGSSNGTPTQGMANGFTWAFAPDSVAFDCNDTPDQILAKNVTHVTIGNTTIFVGMEQIGATDQDPVVARYDGGTKVFCEHSKKGGGVDGRAYGLTWDGAQTLYVVFTIAGGGTLFDQAAQGGWMSSYGNGGASAKVTVVGQLDTSTGVVMKATFVESKLLKNNQLKTNTLVPSDAIHVQADGSLELTAKPSWCSLNPDQSLMCDTSSAADYPTSYRARLSPDLSQMTCASAAGVSVVKEPCP